VLVSILWHFSQDLQWKLKLLNLINPVNSRTNTLVLIFMCQLWLHYTVDIWGSRSVLIGVGSAGVQCNELQFLLFWWWLNWLIKVFSTSYLLYHHIFFFIFIIFSVIFQWHHTGHNGDLKSTWNHNTSHLFSLSTILFCTIAYYFF